MIISSDAVLFGQPSASNTRGEHNPLAPGAAIGSLVFLWLYSQRSKYAWHLVMILVLCHFPLYWVLRMEGIYFAPVLAINDFVSGIIWIVAVGLTARARLSYREYLVEHANVMQRIGMSRAELNLHVRTEKRISAKRRLKSAGKWALVAIALHVVGIITLISRRHLPVCMSEIAERVSKLAICFSVIVLMPTLGLLLAAGLTYLGFGAESKLAGDDTRSKKSP